MVIKVMCDVSAAVVGGLSSFVGFLLFSISLSIILIFWWDSSVTKNHWQGSDFNMSVSDKLNYLRRFVSNLRPLIKARISATK